MKQIILAALLCAPIWASAAPFLYADPTTESVDQYACSIDAGADILTPPVTLVTGSKQLKMDLASMASGSHVITCKAKNNAWGIASAASGAFNLVKPSALIAPLNLFIGAQ